MQVCCFTVDQHIKFGHCKIWNPSCQIWIPAKFETPWVRIFMQDIDIKLQPTILSLTSRTVQAWECGDTTCKCVKSCECNGVPCWMMHPIRKMQKCREKNCIALCDMMHFINQQCQNGQTDGQLVSFPDLPN